MKIKHSLFKIFIAVLISCSAANLTAQELIVNGGFESGTFSGFVVNDPSAFTNVGGDPAFADTGTFHANLGASPTTGSLSQTFATAAGSTYTFSFAVANDSGVAPNFFQALFNGSPLLTITNGAASPYTPYAFSVTAAGTSSMIEFVYRHDDDFFRLDTISVVPEWSSTSYLGLAAVAGFVVYTRSRRNRKSSAQIG